MASRRAITAFLDTNVLLHYPPISDVSWTDWLECDEVKLVLCGQVIDEVDEKKNHPTLSRRANRVIRETRRLRQAGGTVRDNVTLHILVKQVSSDDLKAAGISDSPDARIRYQARQYIDSNPSAEVVIVSEDGGMDVRCDAEGLTCVPPDLEARLETPESEQGKKIRALQQEVSGLKHRSPKLKIVCVSAEKGAGREYPVRFQLSRSVEQLDPESVEKERRSKYKPIAIPEGNAESALSSLQSAVAGRSRERAEEYNEELEEYFEKVKKWAEQTNDAREFWGRSFSFVMEVHNEGTEPAKGVDIDLRLPPLVSFVLHDDEHKGVFPSLSEEPKPPKPPKADVFGLTGFQHSLLGEPFMPTLPDNLIKPIGSPQSWLTGDKGSGFVVRFDIPMLNHHRYVTFPEVTAVFESWDAVESFEANVLITAENIPERIEETISFVFDVSD